MIDIPFNRPAPMGAELEYLARCLQSGHISGDGAFTKACHELLQTSIGVPRALLTTSCTHALEMTALMLDIAPGQEVILPAFTFVSTANAFVLRGARLRFVDIRPDTLNIDERLIPEAITPRTRAIVVVHYAGVGCEMDAIVSIASARGVPIIEDNAHGLFGTYRGRQLGTFGEMATLSFHETKNYTCGEGGALLLNHPDLVAKAEILREKGTDRSRFFRGEVDRYGWVDIGSSYLPSDLLAAVLLAQLEKRDAIQARRARLWENYRDQLQRWCERTSWRQPIVPEHCGQSHHIFYLLAPSLAERTRMISHLKRSGILAVFHYLPLNLSPMGQRVAAGAAGCPVTETVSERLVRLPLFNSLSDEDQARVIDAILSFEE